MAFTQGSSGASATDICRQPQAGCPPRHHHTRAMQSWSEWQLGCTQAGNAPDHTAAKSRLAGTCKAGEKNKKKKRCAALPRTGTAPAVGLGASTTPIRTQLPLQLTARCLPILRLSGVRTHLVTQATQPVTRPVIGGFGGAGEHQFRFLGHQNGEGTRVPRAPG